MLERRHRALAVAAPIIDKQFPIEIEPEAVVGAAAEAVIAIHRRNQLAAPARGEGLAGHAGCGRVAVPVEVYLRIDALKYGRTLQNYVVEKLGLQSGLRASPSCPQGAGRHRQGAGFGERRSGGVEDIRA